MKQAYKFVAIALVIVLSLGMATTFGNYESDTANELSLEVSAIKYYDFTITADNRQMIGYTGKEKEVLSIPEQFTGEDGKRYMVTGIGASAFEGCTNLTQVIIPSTVTTLGEYAFSDCSQLTAITIPGSISYINAHAFLHCSNLKEVHLGYGIQTIGWSAFNGCTSLTNISLPDSVLTIHGHGFHGCDGLKEIYLNQVRYINEYAFAYCDNLQIVSFGSDIQSIDQYAFLISRPATLIVNNQNEIVSNYDWAADNRTIIPAN